MSQGQDVQQTADAAELPQGTEVGGYVVEGKIGEGGMGVVYGAHHPRIGKRVAIKVLSPAFSGDPTTVERFEQEARLVNEIRHPNIVDVFQFGQLPDGRSYFVMEWLEGESLSARLERGPMSAKETIEVLDAMCDALEAAHEKGVIHRDLKSDNVFIVPVRRDKKVKLLDFGLAKLDNRNDPDSIHKTKDGIIVGTPAYMSPEQARGKSVDHRTDIYALGCLSYKMVTGRLPFNADNAMDLIVKQLNDAPPSPAKVVPGTPPSLSRVIQRMMSKAPEDRPTLLEIRETLGDLRAPAAAPAPAKKPRALSVLIGFLLFLCGVITLGVIGLIKQRDDAPAPVAAQSAATPGSAAAAGSAQMGATEPAPAQPAVIEFEDDKVGSAKARPTTQAQTPGTSTPTPVTANTGTGSGSGAATQSDDLVVKPRPGRILVMLERSSQIELDGRSMSTDSKGGTFEVSAGSHTLRITAPGRHPIVRTVDVEAGGTAVMRIDDDTQPSTTPTAPAKTADKPVDKPADKPVDKPADKPVDKPADTHKSEDGVFDPSTGAVVPQD